MDINLEYYRIFYYVGKLGSLTAAAEQLHLSQPAISQGLRSLERALGSAVFVRTNRGIRFTVEGKVLYDYIAPAYEQIRRGEMKFQQLQDLDEGEVRVGASDMTLRYFLLPHLEEFRKRYPKIKLSITNAPTPETLKNMADGNIDFGIISGPFKGMEHYELKSVQPIQDIFIVGKQYREYAKEEILYQDLTKMPYLCLEGNTSTNRYVQNFLQKQDIVLNPEIQLATSDMLVSFVQRGFGVANVVDHFAREMIDKGEVFPLHFSKQIPKRDMYVAYDPKLPMSAAASRLMTFIS